MGLDVTAYRKITKVDAVFDQHGEPIDPITREAIEDGVQLCVNPDFPGRAGGIESGAVYRFEDCLHVSAGSYGYMATHSQGRSHESLHQWRETVTITTSKKEPDWKAIALALGQRVNFAVTRLTTKEGMLFNIETGASRHWHDYMREGLEMIPGITFDDDAFMALRLPPAERRKRLKELSSAKKLKPTQAG